jgi:5-methylcytosine-specific restriction endonuclease McrA
VCQERRKELRATETTAPDDSEVDYYNVRENRLLVLERDNYACTYCGKQLTRFSATLDHVQSVKEGGDNSKENLVTACLECNAKKNAGELSDFLARKTREAARGD